MRYGVIDLGSNTVRLSIYEIRDKKLVLLYSLKEIVGLASFVNEKGFLSELGISKAIEVVTEFMNASKQFKNLNLYCIATAAIRNAKNCLEVIKKIESKTNLKVNLLSGVEEALAGVCGIKEDFKIKTGLVVDIGGGSTEITLIEDEKIIHSISLPIGSLNTYMNHVKELLPSDIEIRQIATNVKEELDSSKFPVKSDLPIYGMGGTLNAIKRLIRGITNKSIEIFKLEDLEDLLKKLDTNTKSTYLELIRHTPERIHTLMPGLIIILTLMTYFKSEDLQISKRGIREGFIRNIIAVQRD